MALFDLLVLFLGFVNLPQFLNSPPTPCPIPLMITRLKVLMCAGGFAANYLLLWYDLFSGGAAALVEWVRFLQF